MFIIIKYGDCFDDVIVNADCQYRAFWEFVRERVPLIKAYEDQNEDEGPWFLDFCDESGYLRCLPEKPAQENVATYFERGCTYIPVLYTKNTDGHYKNLVPLAEEVSPEMDKRLKKYLKVKGKNSRDEAKSISPKTLRKAEKSDSSIRREPISPTAERRERRAKGGGTKSRVPSSTSTSSYH